MSGFRVSGTLPGGGSGRNGLPADEGRWYVYRGTGVDQLEGIADHVDGRGRRGYTCADCKHHTSSAVHREGCLGTIKREHGTEKGAKQHRNRGEIVCPDCKHAEAAARRDRRHGNGSIAETNGS